MIRRLDEFEEFAKPGAKQGSLRAARREVGDRDEAKVVAYLRSAPIVLDVMERLPDVFTGELIAETASLCTDGVWYWREDLAHYVERYHISLPEDFGHWLARRNFSSSPLSHDQLRVAIREIIDDWGS